VTETDVLTTRAGAPTDRPPRAGADGKRVIRRPAAEDLHPARFRRRRRALEVSLGIGLPVVLVALWQVAADRSWIDTRFFPAPSRIWTTGVELYRTGELGRHMRASVVRLLYGFSIGSVLGVALAVVFASVRLLRAACEPLLYALWTVPKLALLPMLLLIFGIGEKPIIILIVINCFFLVFIPTLAAMLAVPFSFREAATSFEASRWQMLRHVIFPCAIPQIFVSLRLAAGASILVLVAVEFIQSREGIGFVIWNSWSLFLADRMYVGIVIVAVSGALFTLAVASIGRRLTPWDEQG
jgi:ABC-type nitrate/sulfonate/bicarbonate transport system permease component